MTRTLFALVPALLALTPCVALSQPRGPRPWTPPGVDSLVRAAAEIKVMLQRAEGDSVGGDNFYPYEHVGAMGRTLLRSLGRERAAQALYLEAVFDTLGLDTQVAMDPGEPGFTLLVVRNPWRPLAPSVGFLYWWRVDDLRQQGSLLFGGKDPRMRVWWTGEPAAPYEVGVLDKSRFGPAQLHFTLYRLEPNGFYWELAQYTGRGPDLGGAGEGTLTDINGDGTPELVVWVRTENDSMFTECPECPKLLNEATYVRRKSGFELLEQRIVPTPYSTFSVFVHLLVSGQREQAARLLAEPGRVDDALARGWGRRVARGTWTLERSETGEAWPQWMGFAFDDGSRRRHYLVRFGAQGARWTIQGWEELDAQGRPVKGGMPGAAKPAGARPGARGAGGRR